jgi:predicted outer membrane repeat protein
MKHKLTTALLLALCVPIASATTWYVNGISGSNSNNCKSPTTPCKTIGHAISLAVSGDSIIVAAATYSENLFIGKSLRILGSGAATTIIEGGGIPVIGISTGASVTLSKVQIRNGVLSFCCPSGGGINNSGTLMVVRSVVSGNKAASRGGGIYNSGTLTISNSTVRGNSVGCLGDDCKAGGGGIANIGILTINNSTLNGNGASAGCFSSCSGDGGGIYNSGTLRISNSTLSANEARSSGNFCCSDGGAIFNVSGAVTISNSTLSGNSARVGGGIFGTAALQNSIVANNSATSGNFTGNCVGTMTSKGYNLSSDGSCNFNGPGDMNHTNPLLGPLQNNGGPTQTMALLSGSPAIDSGNPSGCTDGQGHPLKTDQRGKLRPDIEDTAGCDRGAFESQAIR